MKTRSGFVSNSSSSSFIIVGVKFDDEEQLISKIEELDPKFYGEQKEQLEAALEEGCMWELSEVISRAFGNAGLEVHKNYWDCEIHLGVKTDPCYLSYDECINGFVTTEQKEILDMLAESTGTKVDTTGGVEEC